MKEGEVMVNSIKELVGNIVASCDVDNLTEEEYDKFENMPAKMEKKIQRYIQNIFEVLDIKLTTYTKGRPYKFDEWLEVFFKSKFKDKKFLNLLEAGEIKEAFSIPNEFALECLNVVKHFNDINFTGETYEEIKAQINQEKEKICQDLKKQFTERERVKEAIDSFIFAIIGKEMSLGELDVFLEDVQRCYAECSQNKSDLLTERDIMLINFLSLPNVIKNAHRKMIDESIRNNVLKFTE